MDSGTRLFAEHGFRGASVRDICNLARSNPGSVSYHFGGKRQLYRTVLRHAAERLAAQVRDSRPLQGVGLPATRRIVVTVRRLLAELTEDPLPTQLLLHDLADGGSVAAEALAPALGTAFSQLRSVTGHGDSPEGAAIARQLFLELAAPLFLVTVGWPIIEGALTLDTSQRDKVLVELLQAVLSRPQELTSERSHVPTS